MGCHHNSDSDQLPNSNLSGLMSTPITRLAPAFFAPIATAKPTAPNPQIATVDPDSILAVFRTAPYPVEIPQPKRQIFSSGASAFT